MNSLFNQYKPVIFVIIFSLTSCSPITWVGLKFLYRPSPLATTQIVNDLCYFPDLKCKNHYNKLDLYLPNKKNCPVLIFVHGGGWDSGDKQLKVAGADVYSNIGRYYANQGILVAVINYRLQPEIKWENQVEDVQTAAKWVKNNIEGYGGDKKRIFLMGHSAGAYLATFSALKLNSQDKNFIQGVISVSGAGLDISDEKTYALGADIRYYEERFKGADLTDKWKRVASPVRYINQDSPPFLILAASGESRALQRQATCLKEYLDKVGIRNELVLVPGESHTRIVLTLSRPDKTSAPSILKFIEKNSERN